MALETDDKEGVEAAGGLSRSPASALGVAGHQDTRTVGNLTCGYSCV